jgi:hypothetical protein
VQQQGELLVKVHLRWKSRDAHTGWRLHVLATCGTLMTMGAQALVAPARLIASNAGVEGDVIIEKLMGQPFEMGYNAVRPAPHAV